MRHRITMILMAAFSFFPVISGCSAMGKNAPLVLPPYIHKLAVRAFTNHTQQYGLEDKLTLAVQSEFNRDGRYQITKENLADGVVIGDITHYTLEPLSYDSNHVPTEYKLTIRVAVSFFDRVKSSTLWQEPAMNGELRYFVASSGFAGSMTEEDARQIIFDMLARDIRTRTLEGLGGKKDAGMDSALGASTDTYHAKTVDNSPPSAAGEVPSSPSPTAIPY